MLLLASASIALGQPLPPNPGTGLPPITHTDATYRNLGSSVLVPGQCVTVGSAPTYYFVSSGAGCGGGGGGGSISAGTGIVLTGGGTIVNLIVPVTAPLGGTGVVSPTAHGVMVGEGASAMTPVVGTSGQAFFGVTSNDPIFRAILASDLPTLVTPGSCTNCNISFNAQGQITVAANGAGGGGGTVSSVGLTVPSYETVSGSPVTGSGTLAVTLNNENANLIFAGPVSGSAASPAFRAGDPSDFPGTSVRLANSGSTGTTLNKLVKIVDASAPVAGIIASAGDTQGIIGICIQNCGTTGSAVVQQNGTVGCAFDNATVAGDFVQISTSVAGDCTDVGNTYPTSGGEVVGTVTVTNGAIATNNINLFTPDVVSASNVGTQLTSTTVNNDTSTGTVVNKTAIYAGTVGPNAIIGPITAKSGFIGIVTAGAGTSGSATIATSGPNVKCIFDGATTSGHFVIPSVTTAGDCHDSGTATQTVIGGGTTIFGTIQATHGSGGTYPVANFKAVNFPNTLANISVCDESTLQSNGSALFVLHPGGGSPQFCNDAGTAHGQIGGTYNWQGDQQFTAGINPRNGSHIRLTADGGSVPTVSSCGTSPTQPGGTDTDNAFAFITGTTLASCKITFVSHTGSLASPVFICEDVTAGTFLEPTYTNSAGQIDGFTLPVSSDTHTIKCVGMMH